MRCRNSLLDVADDRREVLDCKNRKILPCLRLYIRAFPRSPGDRFITTSSLFGRHSDLTAPLKGDAVVTNLFVFGEPFLKNSG